MAMSTGKATIRLAIALSNLALTMKPATGSIDRSHFDDGIGILSSRTECNSIRSIAKDRQYRDVLNVNKAKTLYMDGSIIYCFSN